MQSRTRRVQEGSNVNGAVREAWSGGSRVESARRPPDPLAVSFSRSCSIAGVVVLVSAALRGGRLRTGRLGPVGRVGRVGSPRGLPGPCRRFGSRRGSERLGVGGRSAVSVVDGHRRSCRRGRSEVVATVGGEGGSAYAYDDWHVRRASAVFIINVPVGFRRSMCLERTTKCRGTPASGGEGRSPPENANPRHERSAATPRRTGVRHG